KTERMKLLYKECLSLCAQTGKGYGISCLFNLAKIFLAEHDVERAAKLLGTVSTRVDLLGTCYMLPGMDYDLDFENDRAAVQAQLDDTTFAAAFAEGQAMTIDRAIALALSDTSPVETL